MFAAFGCCSRMRNKYAAPLSLARRDRQLYQYHKTTSFKFSAFVWGFAFYFLISNFARAANEFLFDRNASFVRVPLPDEDLSSVLQGRKDSLVSRDIDVPTSLVAVLKK